MKKLLGILVLGLLFCNEGYAEWYKLSAEKNLDHYIEKKSIKKIDGFVYYWEMVDLKEKLNDKYLSFQRYIMVDCTLIRFQTLNYKFFSKNMGRGQIETMDSVNKDWKYDPPGSLGEYAMKYACKKAK